MKKNKLQTRTIIIGALVVVFGLVISFSGMANVSFKEMVAKYTSERIDIDKVTGDLNEPVDENLGGSGGTFQTDWYKVGNRVTWVKSGQFADASVNLLSFLNPADYGKATSTNDATYNALIHELSTSTVMNLNLDITGLATSTMRIICGGATNATAMPTYELFNLTLPTSTIGVFNNGMFGGGSGGYNDLRTGTTSKILLTHEYNYFNCVATSTPTVNGHTWSSDAAIGGKGGLTGESNTFDGYWSVEVIKNLQ